MAEGLNQYETVIIISAKQGEEGNAALIQKFKERIERNGKIDSVDEWGKRRLAYPINKENEGYYTLINFTSAADYISELDRRYRITDGVLRSLIIKKDPKQTQAEAKRQAKKTEETTIDVEAVAADIAAETEETKTADTAQSTEQ